MIERAVVFGHADGLHSRPALALAEAVLASGCAVWVNRPGDSPTPADDLMALMRLGIRYGETLIVHANEEGAEQVLDALVILLANNRPATE